MLGKLKLFEYFSSLDKPGIAMPEKSVSTQTRAKWLLEICEEHVKKFVLSPDQISKLLAQTTELGGVDEESRTVCRASDCNRTYAYHSGRVR